MVNEKKSGTLKTNFWTNRREYSPKSSAQNYLNPQMIVKVTANNECLSGCNHSCGTSCGTGCMNY